jgi:hypothetical protein
LHQRSQCDMYIILNHISEWKNYEASTYPFIDDNCNCAVLSGSMTSLFAYNISASKEGAKETAPK